jgi:ketosteroid isomerase-like protein
MNGSALHNDVAAWAEAFALSVRSGDLDSGRSLFLANVLGFGTRSRVMTDLDQLVDQQWRHIWQGTRGFQFDLNSLQSGGTPTVAWLAAEWTSEGHGHDGRWFPRRGRATFILEMTDGGWRCRHSHHSLDPTPEPLAAIVSGQTAG